MLTSRLIIIAIISDYSPKQYILIVFTPEKLIGCDNEYPDGNMRSYKPNIEINCSVIYSIGLYAINLIESSVPENYAQISAIVCNIRRLAPDWVAINIFGCRPEAGSSVIVSSFLMGLARGPEPEIRSSGECDVQMDLIMPSPDGFGS